jgi:DNA helicase-2/ATP-dependent DNA helicase PcrA
LHDDFLEHLTEPQRTAATHVNGPLLILAGPGSGKTRVVTHRVAYLLRQGVAARNILALTFTNKAADEMQARIARLAPGQRVWVSTFHRFCARLLREYAPLVGLTENYTIYDTSDSQAVLKRVMHALDIDPGLFSPQQIAHHISWAKNNLITAEQYQPRPGHPIGSIVAAIYPPYQNQLLRSSAVDFDDLLMHIATLLRENPEVRSTLDERFRYILVDEYQDTNLAQYAIVRALSLDHPNLAVTGDPDQSIYGWRGANLSNILEFEQDYPDVAVVRLEQNYRSTKRILRAAGRLITFNKRRKAKELFTDNDEGSPVRLVFYPGQKDEAAAIAERIAVEVGAGRRQARDFAVFYRTNALSRAVESALREHGIAYQVVHGVEFYQRKEIKDIVGYLTLLNNPRDDVAFLRTVNTPTRGIGKSTLEKLSAYARGRALPLLEAARESGLVESIPKKAAVALAKFVSMYDRLSLVAIRPVEEILGHVLTESGYQAALVESLSPEDEERLANIQELLTAAREFDERTPGEGHLEEFLEEACLVNDTDDWQASDDRVTLMTLHASKGLEFPVVFLIALEQGLLPHERSRQNDAELEEERRLLFVGMTRAQQELHLSLARHREFRGQGKMTIPSQFLMELPVDEFDSQKLSWTSQPFDDAGHDDAGHDIAQEHEDWDAEDDSFEPAELERSSSRPAAAPPRALHLMTAAELGQDAAAAPRVSPEVFAQSMLVRHPEYGLGTVVALSGSGQARKAVVEFSGGIGQRSFVLKHSGLRPVRPA